MKLFAAALAALSLFAAEPPRPPVAKPVTITATAEDLINLSNSGGWRYIKQQPLEHNVFTRVMPTFDVFDRQIARIQEARNKLFTEDNSVPQQSGQRIPKPEKLEALQKSLESLNKESVTLTFVPIVMSEDFPDVKLSIQQYEDLWLVTNTGPAAEKKK